MITLSEFKSYINITETDNDSILQGFINTAVSKLDSLCNRKFLNRTICEYIYPTDWNDSQKYYLKQGFVNSVVSIKYWNDTEYVTLFTGTDDVCNSVQVREDFIYLLNGYNFYKKNIEIVYNAGYKFQTGTGTVNTTVGSKDITGVSSYFTDEVSIGDYILIEGQRKQVTIINSATSLTLDSAFDTEYTGVSFNISNVPEDLRQGCKELASKLYYDSGIGLNTLIKSNESVSGQTSGTSTTFKELDLTHLINQYRFLNI